MDARQRSTTTPKIYIYGKKKPTSSLRRLTHKIEKKKMVDQMRPATNQDDRMFQIISKWNIKKKNKEETEDRDYKARILTRWSRRMTMDV